MNDQEDELYLRVRAVLTAAGFEEIATGGEGVQLIHPARGVTVGWMPTPITRPATRQRGRRRTRPLQADLSGLRHAFGLVLAVTLRAAGLTVENRDDQWLRRGSADAAGDIDWLVQIDSTIVRAHQHAAATRRKGGNTARTNRTITPSADPAEA